jgi:hypothetical protein
VLLYLSHRGVDRLADIAALRQIEQMIVASPGSEKANRTNYPQILTLRSTKFLK